VPYVLRQLIPLRNTWGVVNFVPLFLVVLYLMVGQQGYECFLAPPPYLIRIVTSLDNSGPMGGFPICKIREHDTIQVFIGGDLGHERILLSIQAQSGVISPTLRGTYEGNKLIIPVEKGQATLSYQHNSLVNEDEDTLTISMIRCGKRKGAFPLRLIIR
jgi:hypothetical protein